MTREVLRATLITCEALTSTVMIVEVLAAYSMSICIHRDKLAWHLDRTSTEKQPADKPHCRGMSAGVARFRAVRLPAYVGYVDFDATIWGQTLNKRPLVLLFTVNQRMAFASAASAYAFWVEPPGYDLLAN